MQDAANRNIFQRILGICATGQPSDTDCWKYENGRVFVNLRRTPELEKPGNGIRLEKKNIPERVLVIKGDDNLYYAFRNRCAHAKRRMDPLPGTKQIRCCSVGKSTFTYDGKPTSGSAKEDIEVYEAHVEGDNLVITL